MAFYGSTLGGGVKRTKKPVKEAKGVGAALVDGACVVSAIAAQAWAKAPPWRRPSRPPASPKQEEELLREKEEAGREADEWGLLVSERD